MQSKAECIQQLITTWPICFLFGLLCSGGAQCEDGDQCTLGTTCSNGECIQGLGSTTETCSSFQLSGPCKKAVCLPSLGCVERNEDDFVSCDRGKCTQDRCENGQCVGFMQKPGTCASNPLQPCTQKTCDVSSGVCLETYPGPGKQTLSLAEVRKQLSPQEMCTRQLITLIVSKAHDH